MKLSIKYMVSLRLLADDDFGVLYFFQEALQNFAKCSYTCCPFDSKRRSRVNGMVDEKPKESTQISFLDINMPNGSQH